MNARERVMAALDHQETDQIPVDFGGHRSSGIMVQAYKRLREALGLPPSKLYIFDFIQQLAIIEEDVLDAVGADLVELGHDFYKQEDYWQDWQLEDGTPCKIPAFIDFEETDQGTVIYGDEGQVIAIKKKGCLYVEQTYFPYYESDERNFDDLAYQLDQIMWVRLGTPPAPAGFDEEGLQVWERTARELRQSTDRAIYATFGGNFLEMGQFAFRIDNFLMELAHDPERVHNFLDKVLEMHLANLEKFISAVGDYVDLIGFGDDLGMQHGPQMSPRMYREFFKPRHKKLWGRAKELCPGAKISLHSCGDIYPLLGDLIEAGLEAVNPVQISADQMELKVLKDEFGDQLTFWGGGCDTQEVLPKGTPEEIREHVTRNLDIMAPGGGFVFQQVHNIMANVPAGNILAMFDTVKNYQKQPEAK